MLTSGPIIWSETRQELCESLPYYRAYQTGCYVTGSLSHPPSKSETTKSHRRATILKDSIPYGYLLAGFPSQRDAWAHNGRVIISHGGGKSEVASPSDPKAAKKASLKEDQSANDSTIRALLHSARHRLPIVLIAADSYALLPFKLPCGYAVLGWYLITDCWAEREGSGEEVGFVRWKLRFEWIPAQGEPWWQLNGKGKEKEWNPRLRVETFTKAQRRLAKQMRGHESTSSSTSRSSSASSSAASSTTSSARSTPKPIDDDDERHQLLYGPLKPIPNLIHTASSRPDSAPSCTLSNAASCLSCHSPSPLVFDLGWMCLQPSCRHFFLLPSSSPPPDSLLHFSSTFLLPQGTLLNDSFPNNQPPFSLIPRRPSSKSMDQARGLWCKRCGRLSCRELIYQPRCAHCGEPVGKWKPLPTVPPPNLSKHPFDFGSTAEGVFDPIISPTSGIKMSVRKEDGLAMYSFTFPVTFGDCKVHLVQADADDGWEEEEANRLLEEVQRHAWPFDPADEKKKKADSDTALPDCSTCRSVQHQEQPLQVIPFRRHILKQHGAGSGRMLTQQFTCNYGVPYKHVVAMGTSSLDHTSPPVITSTLSLLSSRTSSVTSFDAFNELYPVLYLEHQKMSFHDDGEPGLGPVVSSLSLGSTCRMKFRLKQKYLGEGEFKEVDKRDRVLLDLPLRHGSVVVQEGHDLQKYVEHAVNPDGFRVAVTARRIDVAENGGGGGGEGWKKRGGDTNAAKRGSIDVRKNKDGGTKRGDASTGTARGRKKAPKVAVEPIAPKQAVGGSIEATNPVVPCPRGIEANPTTRGPDGPRSAEPLSKTFAEAVASKFSPSVADPTRRSINVVTNDDTQGPVRSVGTPFSKPLTAEEVASRFAPSPAHPLFEVYQRTFNVVPPATETIASANGQKRTFRFAEPDSASGLSGLIRKQSDSGGMSLMGQIEQGKDSIEAGTRRYRRA